MRVARVEVDCCVWFLLVLGVGLLVEAGLVWESHSADRGYRDRIYGHTIGFNAGGLFL